MKKRETPKIPVGIRVLINYSIILGVFYFVFGLFFPFALKIDTLSTSSYVVLSNVVTLGAMVVLIYGFYQRTRWAWRLALGLYTFSILNSMLTLFYIRYGILNYIADFITSTFIFTVFLNVLTIWYIYERKDYFFARTYHPHIHLADKVFISSVYIFYFFAIVFVVSLGFEFYKSATYTVDVIVEDLAGMTYEESLQMCRDMRSIDRDVCYVTVATMHRHFDGSRDLCELVRSDFYKLTCYQATL
jgi:hypothetical protein